MSCIIIQEQFICSVCAENFSTLYQFTFSLAEHQNVSFTNYSLIFVIEDH